MGMPRLFDSAISLSSTSVMFTTSVTLIAGVGQIALDGVEDHRADHVADVAGLVDRRPAEIDADLARPDRLEGFFGTCQGVVDAEHERD